MNSAGQGRPGDPYGDKPDTYQLGYPTVVENQIVALKPCPFCGAKAMLVYCVHGIGANWAVECVDTHAHRMEFSGTQDEVIKEWNRRVNDVSI